MSLIMLFLLLLLWGSPAASRRRRHYKLSCGGANEVYLPQGVGPRCGDALCEPRPPIEGRTSPALFMIAPAGCYCRAGYARNCEGRCVPTERCEKPRCRGPNEMYVDEEEAPPCDPTCRRLDRHRQCNKHEGGDTVDNCFCVEGTARNDNGTCIPLVNCPLLKRRCFGTNEIFLSEREAPRHDAFCDQRTMSAAIELDDENTGLLVRAGCYCRGGYVRNENMQCVEQRFCNVKCPGKNEIFLPRGSAPRCETKCSGQCPQSCLPVLDTPEGCYCRKDFCKDENGACVPENTNQRCRGDDEGDSGGDGDGDDGF